jgi:prepilin-type N-terminal cleavage/methylation domain-containing protein
LNRRSRAGFTLIELMIAASIISLLIAVAIPRISGTIRLANEASTKAKLGSIRTALSIYYADNDGAYPSDLDPLMRPGSKYLARVLPLYTGAHGERNSVQYSSARSGDSDTGAWGYVNSGSETGTVWVDCSHTDSKNHIWNAY